MWECPKCGRIFKRKEQTNSCKVVPLKTHFENKPKAKELFDDLVKKLEKKTGPLKIISIPCCVHLFGTYDFLAALPKKDSLEIRFALDREIKSPRLKDCVPMSKKVFKNCLYVKTKSEINAELLGWLKDSYNLKN